MNENMDFWIKIYIYKDSISQGQMCTASDASNCVPYSEIFNNPDV